MRKSCISLVLSGVLAGLCADDQIIANFGDKSSGSESNKGTYNTATKGGGTPEAVFNTDWYGSDTRLSLKTDGLTFTFGNGTATSLLFKDGFLFENNLQGDSKANVTIESNSKQPKANPSTLIFGEQGGRDRRVLVGKNIDLTLKGFSEVKVQGNLWIGEGSSLSALSSDSKAGKVSNVGGIVLQKQSTLKAGELDNQGTLVMGDESKLEIQSIKGESGKFDIQGNGQIQFSSSESLRNNTTASIEGQTFNLWSGKTLTLGVQNGAKTLTTLSLGGDKQTSFVGQSKNEVQISGFTALESKNLSLSNVILKGDSLNELKNTHLSLNNAYIFLGNTENQKTDAVSIKLSSVIGQGKDGTTSTFHLIGTNNLITAGNQDLKLEGTHSFQGGGSLDLWGKNIILGENSTDQRQNQLLTLQGKDSSTLALKAQEAIKVQNLKVEGLHLQVLNDSKASLQNTTMELGGGTILEAVNQNNQLVDLEIVKSNGESQIKITNGGSATLKGKNISIVDSSISFENSADKTTTLILQALEGKIVLGNGSDTIKIEGKNTTIDHNILDLSTSQVYLGKNVELNKLNVIAGNNEKITFYGTQGGSVSFKNGTTITAGRGEKDQIQYGEMIFSTQFESAKTNQTSTLKFEGDTMLKASNITFQNQQVELGTATAASVRNGTTATLKLFALGGDGKAENGAFNFVNTAFKGANRAAKSGSNEVALYANQEAVLMANGLVLDGVNLSSYSASVTQPSEPETPVLNALDLSASTGKLTALSNVTIAANGIYTTRTKIENGKETTEKVQGIGMDIHVGDSSKMGNLLIKSNLKSEEFVIGGNLVIDNSTANGANGRNGAQSTLKIELGSSGSDARETGIAKLEDQTLGLNISGGITAIGKDSGSSSVTVSGAQTTTTTTEIKAKNFTFGETSNLTSINGTLKLNTKEDSEIEIKGTTILQGTSTAEAKIEAVKANGASGVANASNDANVRLKLHDIQSTGKGSISNAGLTFVDSNIKVTGANGAKDLVLTDTTIALVETDPVGTPQARGVTNLMSGTISSITLDGGNLEFKRTLSTKADPKNTAATASIKLNAKGFISSSGDSQFKVKTIYVGENDTDLFSLKVSNGSFKLIEEATQNKIGEIALENGNFIFQKSSSTDQAARQGEQYHDLKLQANLASTGDSSIKANSIIGAKNTSGSEESNYTISSKNGELRFDLMSSQAQTLENDFVLSNGGLSFYDANSQAMSKITFKNATITATGDSHIKAQEIDLGGATVSASAGTLSLQGIKTNTLVGNVTVGNAGILEAKNSGGSFVALRVQEGSSVSLSAVAPYISPSDPLGGGAFGRVNVGSLLFEGQSSDEKKLINVSISSEASNASALKDDSLFLLREGKVTLVDTESGIKKKTGNAKYENLTLEDVSVDKGGYTSITLTPEIQMAKTQLGEEIAKKLNLGISVSQTTITELMESIKDSNNKQVMEKIFSDSINSLIVESILQSSDNVFKVGIAEYISSGNVEVVDTSLRYMREAFQGATQGIYASDKIAQELKMIRNSNLENRMVRSGNPYVSKTEIAHLLQSLSGVRYANEDDGILLDEGYSGPDYGALWASYEGAISFGTLENASVNGLSAGYDTLVGDLKEYLIGFYAHYGYGTYGSNFIQNASHNFGLGFYSRMTFGSNEVDVVLSQSVGLNQSRLNLGASQALTVQYLNQNLKYNFYITDAQVRYGYLIAVGEEESPFYFKPFGGVDFGFTFNGEARGDGVASIQIEKATHFQLNLSLGLEMKKYFNEGSYIYLLPVLEKGLFNDGNVLNLGFTGAPKIPYAQVYQVDTSVGLYAGGQGSVGNNVSITGGLGVKMDVENKDVLTNWNIGFKYKF
ncbi:autotransporter outer membrane beta-barrel domain-containing protein [Helicobacter kayseriensis]|uniref:autotransporter outer membrane beta-barrel domain-containing protein n=1 Tax=Helicobacter kayseriensis TaxID=2905877 RepID=UPI001E59213B|nr:autotransporter outer membrane beta-barrel domain-containing protein [Helicobacter kayseriensis]MCE3047590.1 autotransporter outer membrane beta-barrel domain-containing protein [Helicobacter kayseriensis]MCE3048961.1 autotransporter outer membrane beta-barrel domain-containing protein [Helicobacter kayseriensis]